MIPAYSKLLGKQVDKVIGERRETKNSFHVGTGEKLSGFFKDRGLDLGKLLAGALTVKDDVMTLFCAKPNSTTRISTSPTRFAPRSKMPCAAPGTKVANRLSWRTAWALSSATMCCGDLPTDARPASVNTINAVSKCSSPWGHRWATRPCAICCLRTITKTTACANAGNKGVLCEIDYLGTR